MNAQRLIIILAALAVGFIGGTWISGDDPAPTEAGGEAVVYRCPMHPTVVSDRPGTCPVCGMDLVKDRDSGTPGSASSSGEREILYWRAPMDPSYTRDEPGKSPMGMDLVPVYADEAAAEGAVRIDPATVQNIGVKTTTVQRQVLKRTIRTVGRVDYDETLLTDVNTKVAGWVEKLYVDYTGQKVRKGQRLLEIYSPELVAAQEEYLTALDYHRRIASGSTEDVEKGARDLLSSARQRLLYWDITEDQIRDLEKTRSVQRTMVLHSPQQGVVVHKAVYDGAHIKAGEHLYRIADLSRVWVYADVYEYELPWLKEGQSAEVELSYQPGKVYRGEVTYIYPFLDSKTRTVKVRMAFENPDGSLKPEMYANVRIRPEVSKDALVVPMQAVIRSGERNVVIRALGDGRFMPRNVVTGVEADGVLEVLKGLEEGDRIVTSAQFLIDSESNLKAALTTMEEPKGGGGESMEMDSGMQPDAAGPDSMDHSGHSMEEGSSMSGSDMGKTSTEDGHSSSHQH